MLYSLCKNNEPRKPGVKDSWGEQKQRQQLANLHLHHCGNIAHIRSFPVHCVYEEYQFYILSAECFGLVSIHRLGEAWRQNKQSPEIGNTQSGWSRTDLFSQSQIWQGISQYVGEIHQGGHQISISYPVRPIRNTSILTMSEEMDILEKVDINMNNQSCHLHRFKRTDQKDG